MCFAWQGWRVSIPVEWNPQKLEGDFHTGHALLSDLHGPRLGVRWRTLNAKVDTGNLIETSMLGEVGKLAADEAVVSTCEGFELAKVYIEPDPPGRDVWIAKSSSSGRIIQLTVNRRKGESPRMKEVLNGFQDCSGLTEHPWSVFDLNCALPKEWKLSSKMLNAGDLALGFRKGRDQLMCRQLALADLALKRQPLERWLRQACASQRAQYMSDGESSVKELTTRDGRMLKGLEVKMPRKRLLAWAMHLPKSWVIVAYHDADRDRLVLGQATDSEQLDGCLRSIGTVK